MGNETTFGTSRICSCDYLPGVSHWVMEEAPGEVSAMPAAFVSGGLVPGATEG
jgi:hypothetical protein